MTDQKPEPKIHLHMILQDSAPTLVEWVVHHRRLGFTDITVHDDGANRQARDLGGALHRAGLIRFVLTETPGQDQAVLREQQAYEGALSRAQEEGADYVFWLEPAEFVHISAGDGTVQALFAELPERPDILSLTQQRVGGDGQMRYAPDLLAARFRRGTGCAPGEHIFGTGLRSFASPDVTKELKVTRPRLKPKYKNGRDPVSWLDGAGKPTGTRYIKNGWAAPRENPGYGLARVLCYTVQDRESWLLRHLGSSQSLPFIRPESLQAVTGDYARRDYGFDVVDGFDDILPAWRADMEQLLAGDAVLRAAQEAVIAEFSSRLDRLMEVQIPEARAAITTFLQGDMPDASVFVWATPYGVETTRPILTEQDSSWAAKLVAHQDDPARSGDGDDEDADWTDVDEGDATGDEGQGVAAQDLQQSRSVSEAPGWLGDLRLSGDAYGFYHSMPNYACTYVARSAEHLLVSFDNLASVRENPVARQPWGYDFVRKEGWSHLGVLSFVPGWFRDAALHDYLLHLKESGFFRQFRSVTMFGTSMGAYGAAVFASLAPGCRVAAFSPQSSLSAKIAPWDFRYPAGRRSDWSGAFSDAAEESRAADKLWLFYDPAMENDRKHAERFTGGNVCHVPLRYADHKTALMLRNGKVLSKVMREVVADTATLPGLMRLYRSCRMTNEYREGVLARAKASGGAARLDKVRRFYKAQDQKG